MVEGGAPALGPDGEVSLKQDHVYLNEMSLLIILTCSLLITYFNFFHFHSINVFLISSLLPAFR